MNKDELKLAKNIRHTGETGKPIETPLTTNERVLARITEGIYRQPSSALRELISNAYDADAREVVILTDAPRFSTIIVRDDGLGLTPETLIHMLKNIGGSAKRTKEGQALEITAANDVTRSPGGRRLIGKLGIGLFAVAQFTRHFLIITKQKGDKFRTIADITLGPLHNEQKLLNYDRSNEPEIETGNASIICEPVGAKELDSQGTEIKLLDLLPRTRTELASQDLWAKLDYRYVIQPDPSIEMLSLGFLITPHYSLPVDPTGMSTLQPATRPFPTELQSALGLVSIAANIRDVDKILGAEPVMREQLTASKADLLAAAGFDRDAFLLWVANGERDSVE